MVIGVDLGNNTSISAFIVGIDERTRRGGIDVILLPPMRSKTGIPSSFHFKRARHADEQDIYSYGAVAAIAAPRANHRDSLTRRLQQSEAIDGTVINYDDVITGMIKHIVDTANDELVKDGYPHCNKIALAYPVIRHAQSDADQAPPLRC